MLVSIVALGLSQGTFDLTQMGTSGSVAMFLGFAIAFGIKAPLWPFHGWLPDAYRESSPEVAAILSGVISKTAAYGFLRIALPIFPEPVETMRDTILVLAAIGLVYGSLLAFRAARLPRRDRILEPGADVPDPDRALRRQRLRRSGRAAPDDQPRPHLGGPVPAGGLHRAPHRDRPVRAARRHGARETHPGDDPDHDRGDRARGARLLARSPPSS